MRERRRAAVARMKKAAELRDQYRRVVGVSNFAKAAPRGWTPEKEAREMRPLA